jgi:hypothetical protein
MCPTCGGSCSVVVDRFTDLCIRQCLCCGCTWVTEHCEAITKQECRVDNKLLTLLH